MTSGASEEEVLITTYIYMLSGKVFVVRIRNVDIYYWPEFGYDFLLT